MTKLLTFLTLKSITTYSIDLFLLFLNSKIVEEEINNEFSGKLLKISDNDRLRDEKINSLQVKRNEELEVVGRIREQERNYTGRKR